MMQNTIENVFNLPNIFSNDAPYLYLPEYNCLMKNKKKRVRRNY